MALIKKRINQLLDELEPDAGDFLVSDVDQGGATYLTRRVNMADLPIIPMFSRWQDGLYNVSVLPTVGSNALTLALKQEDFATDPTTGRGKCRIKFRSATLAGGAPVVRDVTSALSFVVSSGSTLGFVSANAGIIYVYAIDNAGVVKLGLVSGRTLDETILHTTTAEGGAGAADSRGVFYSDAVYTDIAVRLVSVFIATEATAGTWATAPSTATVSKIEESHYSGAWTSIITSGAGTLTSANGDGRFLIKGKLCFFEININIVTNGTGATSILATLPFNADTTKTAIVAGRRTDTTGNMVQGIIGTTQVQIRNYDNSYPGATGANIVASGWYEMAAI
jgi:hypothetical protein